MWYIHQEDGKKTYLRQDSVDIGACLIQLFILTPDILPRHPCDCFLLDLLQFGLTITTGAYCYITLGHFLRTLTIKQ